MRNIAQWKRWFADNSDLITPVRTTADIRRAKAEGKTGIILGFQNTSALEDQIGYISLFKELGVGVMQITPQYPEPGRRRLLGAPRHRAQWLWP